MWRARQESNLHQKLRKLLFYPLNYRRLAHRRKADASARARHEAGAGAHAIAAWGRHCSVFMPRLLAMQGGLRARAGRARRVGRARTMQPPRPVAIIFG